MRQDRSGRAAAFSALAVLVRLDSILLPALLAGHALVVRRRLPWREGFIFALIAGPWLIFATTYFGSVIPNSVAAKTHAYLLPPNSALTSILYFLITRSHIEPMRWPLWLNGVVLAGVLVTYALGVRQSIKVQPRSWPLLIYPVLYVAGLSAGNPFVFMWYYLPLTFAVDSLCLIGIAGLASTGRPMVRLAVLGGVIGASLIVQITAQGPFLDKWPVNFQHREWLYRDAAVQLKTAVRPGMTVAAPEIGVLGYDLPQAVIIDTVGLVTPEAIPLLLKSLLPGQPVYVISSEVIAALRPDYLVTLEAFVRPTLLASPEFEQTYQLIGTIETDELGSRGLLIYRRANLSQMDAQ